MLFHSIDTPCQCSTTPTVTFFSISFPKVEVHRLLLRLLMNKAVAIEQGVYDLVWDVVCDIYVMACWMGLLWDVLWDMGWHGEWDLRCGM